MLADEGRPAVTARRLATEAGTSTMAVYTHFGSMEELFVQMCQEGFARFGVALETPGMTDDPVADWVTQGWAYRRFALDNPHLYRVMFGDGSSRSAPMIRRRWRRSSPCCAASSGASTRTARRRRRAPRRRSRVGQRPRAHDDRVDRLLRVDGPRRTARLCRGHAAARPRVWRSARGTRRFDAGRLAQVAPPPGCVAVTVRRAGRRAIHPAPRSRGAQPGARPGRGRQVSLLRRSPVPPSADGRGSR